MSRRLVGLLIGLALLLLPAPLRAQSFAGFNDFLRRYGAATPEAQSTLARSFIAWQQQRGGFPIAEDVNHVLFMYVADRVQHDVRLVGDFRTQSFSSPYWDTAGEPLTRVGSLFYLRRTFEADARLDYRFVVDDRNTLDPLNPRTIVSGAGNGDASVLVMPGHRVPPETVVDATVAPGSLHVVQEAWATPKVTVYLPASYDANRTYPTLYTADGSAWLSYIGLPTILDNLVAAKAIEPVIAVMIDADVDRSAWYNCNPEYLTYLRRVVAFVDKQYPTRAQATARVHAGTSAGGRATAFVGFELPELFGNVALLSSSIGSEPSCLAQYLGDTARPKSLRAWIASGTYERGIHQDTEALAAFFRRAGIPVEERTVHQGHSFGAWSEDAVDMLRYVFRR